MPGLDAYTKLLLHCDGADESTSFPDASASSHTVTAIDNAQVDTAFSKFGSGSAIFDGTGDYLSVPDSDDFSFGSDDFTVDLWIKRNALASTYYIIGQDVSASSLATLSFLIALNPGNQVYCAVSNGSYYQVVSTVTIAETTIWHHIAMVRASDLMYLFIDGIRYGPTNLTGVTVNNSPGKLGIGALGEYSSSRFKGNIDEVRISKGIARWTSDFTLPNRPYSDGVLRYFRLDQKYVNRSIMKSRLDQKYALRYLTRYSRLDQQFNVRQHITRNLDQQMLMRSTRSVNLNQAFKVLAGVTIRLDQQYYIRSMISKRLDQKFDHRQQAGYYVDAVNRSSGAVTYLGFINEGDTTLDFANDLLPVGEYDVRFWLMGYHWTNWLQYKTCFLEIEEVGSPAEQQAAETMPPKLTWADPGYYQVYGRTIINWNWVEQFNTIVPEKFRIWVSSTSPAVLSGDPDYEVIADIPRIYNLQFAQDEAVEIGVAAVDGLGSQGDTLTMSLAYPYVDPESPIPQFQAEEDLL